MTRVWCMYRQIKHGELSSVYLDQRREDLWTKMRGISKENSPLLRQQEIISITSFRRTLSQYQSFGKVARVVVDGYRGSYRLLALFPPFVRYPTNPLLYFRISECVSHEC